MQGAWLSSPGALFFLTTPLTAAPPPGLCRLLPDVIIRPKMTMRTSQSRSSRRRFVLANAHRLPISLVSLFADTSPPPRRRSSKKRDHPKGRRIRGKKVAKHALRGTGGIRGKLSHRGVQSRPVQGGNHGTLRGLSGTRPKNSEASSHGQLAQETMMTGCLPATTYHSGLRTRPEITVTDGPPPVLDAVPSYDSSPPSPRYRNGEAQNCACNSVRPSSRYKSSPHPAACPSGQPSRGPSSPLEPASQKANSSPQPSPS